MMQLSFWHIKPIKIAFFTLKQDYYSTNSQELQEQIAFLWTKIVNKSKTGVKKATDEKGMSHEERYVQRELSAEILAKQTCHEAKRSNEG